jgi:hypothetical protein
MRFESRSEWRYAKSQWETKHLEATDPDTGETVVPPGEPVTPIDPSDAYGSAPEWASVDEMSLCSTGVALQYEGFQKFVMWLSFGGCVTSS